MACFCLAISSGNCHRGRHDGLRARLAAPGRVVQGDFELVLREEQPDPAFDLNVAVVKHDRQHVLVKIGVERRLLRLDHDPGGASPGTDRHRGPHQRPLVHALDVDREVRRLVTPIRAEHPVGDLLDRPLDHALAPSRPQDTATSLSQTVSRLSKNATTHTGQRIVTGEIPKALRATTSLYPDIRE